jgi:hypothetical protein
VCKKGGNVILRPDEIRNELGNMASKALIPTAVRDKPPFIYTSPPAVRMPDLDQSNSAASRNFTRTEGKTEEMF